MTDDGLLACTLSTWQGDPHRCRWCNAELTGRRTRWCSDTCPAEMINNHWMRSARIAVFNRDRGCIRCGKKIGLVAHHRNEPAKGRHHRSSCCHHVDNLEALCEPCHIKEHKQNPVARRPQRRTYRKPSAKRAAFTPTRAPAKVQKQPDLCSSDVAILSVLVEHPASARELGVSGTSLRRLISRGLATNLNGTWTATAYGRERLAGVQACEDPKEMAA